MNKANEKPYWQSKTLWFNLGVALFTVLSQHSLLLRSYLTDGGYLTLLMLISAGNVWLRTVTDQAIKP